MQIIDRDGNRIESPDLALGYLVDVETVHHPAVAERAHFAYREIGGGREQIYVVDAPYRPARDEVTRQMYIPYTEEELEAMRRPPLDVLVERLGARMDEAEEALAAFEKGVAGDGVER